MPTIYEPSEDSYLMSEVLKKKIPKLLNKNPGLKFLEIGCGSGINLQTAFEAGIKKENILGTDINSKAVKHCKSLGFNCIKSILFEAFKGRLIVKGNLVPLQFDVIVFNPPYLPIDKKEPKSSRVTTTGGLYGNELIIKFLKQAGKYLNRGGRIFIITSSLARGVNFRGLGYKAKEVSSANLFFEKLSVWECLKI